MLSDTMISKGQLQAGHHESFQPPINPVVETVQSKA